MGKKYLNNSIISFLLIVSTILMPLGLIPKKAEAQSMTGYATGLGPAIAALPQCKNVINSSINNLFSGVGNLFSSGVDSNGNPVAPGEITGSLGKTASSAASTATSIETNSPNANDLLQKIANSSAANAAADKANSDDATCIASIGRLMIKMLLQKLTQSTVSWIKKGFNGSPAFVQNPSKFFGDIAKNEVLQFGLEIKGVGPFSKGWLQNTAAAFNNKFQDNVRYSLDQLVQQTTPEYSGETFKADFSQGGWNAWTAMTQVPANNPLGFQLMADNELQQRLAGTVQSTAQQFHDTLQQAQGFLGDYRCTIGVTLQQKNTALAAGKPDPCVEGGGTWQYVTPGSMVAYAAQNVMSYQSTSYFNVQDLNDAIAAITDALLSKFSSTIMEKGFANASEEGADGTLYTTSTVDSGVAYQTQTEKDYTPSQLTSSWLAANPDFDIRTDLTQALVDEQRTYSDKLIQQNKELNSTTDDKPYATDPSTGVTNAYGLIPAIYQLDYCIPGPHPGWEQDAQTTLTNVTSSMKSADRGDSSTGSTIGGVVSNIVSNIPVVGGFLSSLMGGGTQGDKMAGFYMRGYYSREFASLTGYMPNFMDTTSNTNDNISSQEGVINIMNIILGRYIDIMDKTYFSSPDYLPDVAKEATNDFNQLTGYNQMIKDNEDKIISLKRVVNTLEYIKKQVDDLNDSYPAKGDEYESLLKPQIDAFGRLSAEMVNGADIASVDNLTKQIVDEKNYVYNTLLKGPNGCEAQLENPRNGDWGNGIYSGTWTAITGTGGEGTATWKAIGNGVGTWKSLTGAGTWTVISRPVWEPGLGGMEAGTIGTFTYGGINASGTWGPLKFPHVDLNGIGNPPANWDNFDVNSVERMTYPSSLPIIYDYNNFIKAGTALPDPWNSGYPATHTPVNKYSVLGPGFLSFVYFSSDAGDATNKKILTGPERLKLWDLVPAGGANETPGNQFDSLGASSIDVVSEGLFEKTIGIY